MISILRSAGKSCALLVACLLLASNAFSAPFTAVASGNWSAAATWGIAAPSFNNTADQIIIPAGITVTMDNNVTVNGPLATMVVAGTLTSNANTTLTVTQGAVTGAGTINVGTLTLGATSALGFTGAITTEYLNSASTAVQLAANTTVSKGLNVTGGILTAATGGTINLMNDATITMSGGTIALNGGMLTLTNAYNVRYTTSAATTGLELAGSGLRNVTIDVPQGTIISLGGNLTTAANGGLTLTGGTLNLNGRNLTVNGALSAAANTVIQTTAASNIAINTVSGITGTLNFNGVASAVNNLTVNTGSAAVVPISGNVDVTGTLNLTSGILRFAGSTLTLSGDVTGNGSLSGDATSNLVVSADGGLTSALRFATGGQTLNNLTVDVGTGNTVRLASNLVLNGTTTLTSGNLNISDVMLTLNGDVAGAGQIAVNAASGLVIETNNGLTSALKLAGSTIGALTINTDAGKTVSLGGDLSVTQALSLQGGTLVLNGNDLNVTGDVLSSATGFISSTSASDITLASATGLTGALNFSGTGNAVHNLTVNVGGSNTARIAGALDVTNSLNLQSGTLNFAGSTLSLTGTVTGSGSLSGNSTSNLVINTATGIASGLRFATGGETINNLTVNVGSANVVKILTDLNIAGNTTLNSGSLDISDYDLSIGGLISGSGSITSNANSGLTINTPNGLTNPISFTGGVIGNLGINVGTGKTVTLGSDLDITKSLSLTGGTLVLNGNDLSIDGNIVGGVNGFIRSTAASDIDITSSTGTTGVLNFAANSTIGNLLVDVGATNTARIAGDLDVMNTLTLTSGALSFNDADLTLNGAISGTGVLSGNAESDLTINTVGSLASGLRFAESGNILHSLTITAGANDVIDLATDLVVKGTTDIGAGTLDISDVALTLGGALKGTGSIATNENSTLKIISDAGINSTLNLTGTAIGELVVDVADNASVVLGSDLNVTKVLDLEGGTLVLNGNDLSLSGVLEATGEGTLSSTNASNISITSTVSSVRELMFNASANTVNNLTIGVANGVDVLLGTDATVDGVLTLTSGVLDIDDYVLTIGTNGSIIGGSSTSYIETAVGGALSMALDAGASAATVFPVGTAIGYFPASIALQPGSASGNVNVGVHEGVFAQGTTGSVISTSTSLVNNTWDVSSDISSNLKMNMEVAWAAATEVNGFNRTQAYISHYTSGAWDATAAASASTRADGMFSLTRDNIQSLSPFAVFDGSTTDVPSDILAANTSVFPSPATDIVVVKNIGATDSPATIEVVDAQGRLVASSVMNGQQQSISIAALASGVYYIHLRNETASTTKSFVKL